MLEDLTLRQFDERLAVLKSLLTKPHIEAARTFATGFGEVSDFEHWVLDHHFDILETCGKPIDELRKLESGEEAMLLMHAIYLLSLGRKLRELFQNRGKLPDSEAELLEEYSLVAFGLRTSRIPFWPFERTNLPLIDGYQNASATWW